ncbi:MAG: molybdenum cofactor guanylyltransferase [Myxococcota bacterium]|nr:molybdenum cofactor guanylyltransferase [Myxococcota bacterium]
MSEAALVLCGGSSRRMGRDKAGLPFGDESLLERVVRIDRSKVDEVWLVAREGQVLPAGAELPVARDPAEGLGPLAGVIAGVRAMKAERGFVVSCDSPLLEADLISHLLELSRGHHAAIPFVDGHYVPTTAIYAKSILPAAVRLLDQGELRPRLLVKEAGVRVVREAELVTIDPELLSFRDCDTPEEYADLLRLADLSYAPER